MESMFRFAGTISSSGSMISFRFRSMSVTVERGASSSPSSTSQASSPTAAATTTRWQQPQVRTLPSSLRQPQSNLMRSLSSFDDVTPSLATVSFLDSDNSGMDSESNDRHHQQYRDHQHHPYRDNNDNNSNVSSVAHPSLEDSVQIIQYLQRNQCHNIKELTTRLKEIVTEHDLRQMVEFLHINYKYIHIEKLRLSSNELTVSSSTSQLVRLIETTLPTLRELDLSDNPLKASGLQVLKDVLTSYDDNSSNNNSNKRSDNHTSHNNNNRSNNSKHASKKLSASPIQQAATNSNDDNRNNNTDSKYKITNLNVSHTGLTGTQAGPVIGYILRNNASIRVLNLSNNSLGNRGMKTIAANLCYNQTVTKLLLHNNKICDQGVGALMDGLLALPAAAAGSAATDGGFENSLTNLDISCNKIGPVGASRISNALLNRRMKNLAVLNISWNQIGSEGGLQFASVLRYSDSICELDISRNNIRDGIIQIADAIRMNRHETALRKLDISWNTMSDESCSHIASMLRDNITIEYLNLSHNAIGDAGFIQLANSLYDNNTLIELDVSDNQMTDPTPFINTICHYDPNYSKDKELTLQSLIYLNNNLNIINEERLSFAIHNFHKNKVAWLNEYIQKVHRGTMLMLNLWLHEHSDEEIIALSNHLRRKHVQQNIASKITQVFIGCNRVTDHGIHSLAAYIFECNHIKQVNNNASTGGTNGSQSSNNSSTSRTKKTTLGSSIQGLYVHDCIFMTIEGVTSISHALMRNRTLRCLSITNCNVDDKGARLIYNILKSNTTLQRLTLENNRIGDHGAKFILRLIQIQQPKQYTSKSGLSGMSNLTVTPMIPTLTSLNISGNGINDVAMTYIHPKSLIPTIREVYLQNNCISDVGANALAKAIADCTTLTQLNISCNYLTKDGIEVLQSAFASSNNKLLLSARQKTLQQSS